VVFTYEQWYTRNSGGEEWYFEEQPCAWPPDLLPEDLDSSTFDAAWEAAREAYVPPPTPESLVANLFDDYMFCEGVGPHISCMEVEVIVSWLRSIDRNSAADTLIAGHCEDDDEGDQHNLEQFDDIDPAEWPAWVKLVKEVPGDA
jgi:hypothetical protein